MGAIEQAFADIAEAAAKKAVEKIDKKIDLFCLQESKRMLNKTEAAKYLGVSLHVFTQFTKSQGFPEDEDGFWAKGWLNEWTSKR